MATDSKTSLYIAGIVLVSLLLLGLCIWFGIFIHNYGIAHQSPTQCHKKGKRLMLLQRYKALAGFNQYSMYVELSMDENVSNNMQFGQFAVCFCGMDGKPHPSHATIPVTYHTDTCYMSIDVADPNIQNAFKAAYGKAAELQTITYNANNNTFNIIAKALGSILYDVTMSTTSESLCQTCV